MSYNRITEKVGKSIVIRETSTNDNKSIWNAIVRLAELEDKIENGTLVELPCKVGTKVFYIQMDYNDDGILYYYVEEVEFGIWCMMYWGEWIFLTKAEAEKRIKELEE